MGALPYRDIIVWQRSRVLASRVFDLAETAPFRTGFFDRDQMCRAAMSVPVNWRSAPLGYAAFIDRAHASLFELGTWLVVAADRGCAGADDCREIQDEISQISAMLKALGDRLRSKRSLESRAS